MGLLNYFKRYFHDIDIYSLTEVQGNWGTTEKEYTYNRTIKGYIQPLTGTEVLKNSSLDKVSTHRLYVFMGEDIKDTDRIKYNNEDYHITYNRSEGVANIQDHKELLLVVQR